MTTNSETLPETDEAASTQPLPSGHENFAGEVMATNGKLPGWVRYVPYVGIGLALGYYILVRAFDAVNLTFAALFVIWLIYTPIAQKRGWFFISM